MNVFETDGFRHCAAVALLLSVFVSCSPSFRLRAALDSGVKADICIPDAPTEVPEADCDDVPETGSAQGGRGEPLIMDAVRDPETGEMVAVDVIRESRVVARFNHVPERLGNVAISFDILVPKELLGSDWQLRFNPVMDIAGEKRRLETVYVTGAGYRDRQLRGYQRYREFVASIITDTADLMMKHQLEMFIARYFPETYAMRNDSSAVPDREAGNLFGVTQREALAHYSNTLKRHVNDRKKRNREKMFRKYVKSPIESVNMRLDTVLQASDGDFVYRYVQTFRSLPGLKKVVVNMDGGIYRFGEFISGFPSPDSLEYYISSLSSLADMSPRYRMTVTERVVRDRLPAHLEFGAGKSAVDTALGNNAEELRRVRHCVMELTGREEFELDSIVVTAACSPEGRWRSNAALSRARSVSVRECLSGMLGCLEDSLLKASCLPEDWERLSALVEADSLVSGRSKAYFRNLESSVRDPDEREMKLRKMKEYGYVRENLYPKLRTVDLDFHMHRRGMVKDTVHTAEPDTAYMRGVECLRRLEYSEAVLILRPYRDYNAALALASAGYDHSAWDVLKDLPDGQARVCYLKALVLSRIGMRTEARRELAAAFELDPSMRHRANLDPEMAQLTGGNKL